MEMHKPSFCCCFKHSATDGLAIWGSILSLFFLAVGSAATPQGRATMFSSLLTLPAACCGETYMKWDVDDNR